MTRQKNILLSKVKKSLAKSHEGKCLISLVENRLHDNTTNKGENFGYFVLGPLVVGFCHWLEKHVKNSGIPQLNFLSRDMKVCYDAWQILYNQSQIEVQYLLTSRRAVGVASIQTLQDMLNLVRETKFSQPLNEYFANRFSFQITSQHEKSLKKAGFRDEYQLIQFSKNLEQLQLFITNIWDDLKISIQQEREAYLIYLEQNKIQDNSGIVDLGYSGTIQKYLFMLTGKMSTGMYVGTNAKVAKLDKLGLPLHSFIIHKANRHTNHPFFRNIPLLEYIFLDKEKSLMCFKKNNDQVEPMFFIPEKKLYEYRIALTQKIHQGALSFAKDWRNNFGNDVSLQNPRTAFALCYAALEKPTRETAALFAGHYFEDNYGKSNKKVCLLADQQHFNHGDRKQAIKISQWKIAAYVLANRKFLGKYWLSRIKRAFKQVLIF